MGELAVVATATPRCGRRPLRVELGDLLHLDHLSLQTWVNDALMTVFFLLVGVEIKREVVHGELRDPRAVALPVIAALGGMVVPAAIYAGVQRRRRRRRRLGRAHGHRHRLRRRAW